ncbi:MAG: hypothetical protein A3J27_02930 [Candidatus Tectomicrobia bacterium RIFCSPLOWO2_12_FULL_69_37]|nr:MAG: hypothetical protein A3I72_06030 [Candidatus Tectomicrobia bacterium RIFCSPLOWO2_02_FULL_70_19]OGL66248.1 MAG: hypothetical protein A3J27_02930 [Candidatus Tectomicrobia bacterium RIFCSPLOWO2_12_FULL_69_37]
MPRRPLLRLLLGLLFAGLPAAAQAARPATLALNWLPGGAHAPLYYGQSAGIFRQAGLDVRLRAARGSREALLALNQGNAQFALAEAAEVYSLRATGIGLVGIMAYFSRGASAVLALRRPDIQKLADLAGKGVGAPRASFPRLLFPELRLGPAFDLAKIRWRDLTPDHLLPALIEGNVDAVAASTLVAHQYREAAAKAGKEIAVFPYAAAGVNPYGLVLVTTEAQIAKDAALVGALAGAVARAAAASLSRPAEALQAHLKENPALGPERNGAEWREAMALIYPPEARRAGLGRFEAGRLQAFQSLMEKIRGLKLDAPSTRVFTNQYLPVLRPSPAP